jgi:hypothetical protein
VKQGLKRLKPARIWFLNNIIIFGSNESLIQYTYCMKILLTVFLLAILSLTTEAQSNNSLVFGKAIDKYQKMETTGTVLTVLGSATLFTGNFLYWKINNNRDTEPSVSKAHTYRNVMFGGLGLMAIGIPLWSIGKTKERHITIDARVVRFNGYVSANGVGLKVRF